MRLEEVGQPGCAPDCRYSPPPAVRYKGARCRWIMRQVAQARAASAAGSGVVLGAAIHAVGVPAVLRLNLTSGEAKEISPFSPGRIRKP